ncbi:DUF5134 domain-containing protein [Streptomyces sp. TS71-3]|uniref:DUF5134 domain-containing protein n=1 Tax=Streptomyces sp. TS71-3 TaxID=2733862 RepID=UPI001AFD2A97|nr:DUF5134 domain-containing protein [Streptomyces sp. TS71-3]GHJ41267.1 DUF5134 domain-containing protein [Streptomyces sp. TS71-3]
MIAATGLRWILTVLFTVLALYALWRALRSDHAPRATRAHGPDAVGRVGHLLHAVMALAMGAMVWPWGMSLAGAPQTVLFALAAAWFAGAALAAPGSRGRWRALRGSLPHVVMMAAMAWMAGAMGTLMPAAGTGGARDSTSMPGMDMSGSSRAGAMTLNGTGARLAAWVLAAVLLVLALWWLARAFDTARRQVPDAPGAPVPAGVHDAADAACHGAMALGMAVMFVLLA